MKRFSLLALLSICFFSVHAAYLKDVPMTLTQPDGSILHCFASGDEYFNYLHDKNGYTIIQHPETGYYVYADKRDGKLVATNFVAGINNPAQKKLTPYNLISPEEWAARRKAWHDAERPSRNNEDWIPNHGTLNNISIFIRFADDQEFTNTFSSIDNMFNDVSDNAVSMRSYFRAASYGTIEIPTTFYPTHIGDIIISYQDTNPRSYYQPYNATTNPNGYTDEQRSGREFGLLERAVNYINENYPIPADLNIDYNNDGDVDNVCFIVRGSVGAWSSLLWPHKWSLYDRDVLINGKRVNVFNFQLADATDYFNTSTMCHEMNHSLSAPDLYHYSHSGPTPIGPWDLMANNTTPPQHCGAYMKMKYGHWIDEIPEITQAGTYTLNPISSATTENIAYKIATEDPNQFYVLEYRDKNSLFESKLPGSGLLIYRIDSRFEGNQEYDPDNGIYDEVYIFRPNGSFSDDGNLNNAFFNSSVGRTEFNSSTSPYPFFSDGTRDANLRIYDISVAGNTISFKYGTNAACEPPTNIAISINGRNATLSWDEASGAQSYNIYRNGILIGNTTENHYTDTELAYGVHNYTLKSVDSENRLSTSSDAVTANVQPISSSLSVTLNDNDAILSWNAPEWSYPETPLATLFYGTQETSGYRFKWEENSLMYWGHRYLASSLEQYNGKGLYKVEFYISEPGDYQICVYKGTNINGNTYPATLIVESNTVTFTTSGWQSIEVTTPIIIDATQDLWVFVHNPQPIAELKSFLCTDTNQNAYGVYYSADPSSYTHNNEPGYAFLLKTYLTDGTYTYNLYDGTTQLASGLTETTYTHASPAQNAAHQYTVKTNYYGGESAASNMAGLTLGTASLSSLELGENDKMTVNEGSKLTVNETLTNTDPANLILEDGAQLINNSEGVKATVKKTIQPYTEGKNDGWHLIASPITECLDAAEDINGLAEGTYDLYTFDQTCTDGKEWRNHEAQTFTTINNTVGYLYSNSDETTISFAGTLASNVEPTTITRDNAAEFKGFNLIGNPYPCEVYTAKPFYTLQYNEEDDKTYFEVGENPIPPCAAILVQAQTDEENISFSKVPIAKQAAITMKLSKANMRSTRHIDQARISFEADCQLSKYTWGDASSSVYIPKNGENYAVACANGQNEMPLNFKAAKNGTYTLAFEVENLDLDYLHLIDNMTGNEVDVMAMPTYTFEAKTSDYASRFKLVFAEPTDGPSADDQPFAYYANGEIRIVADACDASLQVVDVTGRVVVSTGRHTRCVPTTGMVPGVYVLRLIDGDNVRTQKIVIE